MVLRSAVPGVNGLWMLGNAEDHQSGPNPIQITANPSPTTPPLPLTIPVDPQIPPPHRLTWENLLATAVQVDVTAVDTVTLVPKTQTFTVIVQDALLGGPETVIEWNGTEFFEH